MKEPKFLEKGNIPLCLAGQVLPEFFIYKIEKEEKSYRLYYLVEGRGIRVYFEDKDKFDKFPQFFEVVSGGWYGNKGRWAPVERYAGSIICERVSSFKKISAQGDNFKFEITKPFLSPNKTLRLESKDIGTVEFKCKKIGPQKFNVLILSKKEN